MKYLANFILTIFGIYSYSQEKVLTWEDINLQSTRYCFYTKKDMKPFNGYMKYNDKYSGNLTYQKIENGCNPTITETFNSKKELISRDKYTFDRINNQITSYDFDSINLGKSQLFDKKFTDSTALITKKVFNYYNTSYIDDGRKIVNPSNRNTLF